MRDRRAFAAAVTSLGDFPVRASTGSRKTPDAPINPLGGEYRSRVFLPGCTLSKSWANSPGPGRVQRAACTQTIDREKLNTDSRTGRLAIPEASASRPAAASRGKKSRQRDFVVGAFMLAVSFAIFSPERPPGFRVNGISDSCGSHSSRRWGQVRRACPCNGFPQRFTPEGELPVVLLLE